MSKIGGGGGGSDESFAREQARLAAERERLRQERINEGLARIKKAFEGGHVAANPLDQFSVFDPSKTYFDYEGRPWTMPATGRIQTGTTPRRWVFSHYGYHPNYDREAWPYKNYPYHKWVGGDPIYANISPQQRLTEAALSETGLYGDRVNTGGFGDDFYQAYRNAYDEFYEPDLERQRKDAVDQTRFALARTGQLRSSEAARQLADIERQNAEGIAIVRSRGDEEEGELRNRVQTARDAVTNQLYATENPDVASTAALTRVQGLQDEEPVFSPLGQMFQLAATTASSLSRGRDAGDLDRLIRQIGLPRGPFQSSGRVG